MCIHRWDPHRPESTLAIMVPGTFTSIFLGCRQKKKSPRLESPDFTQVQQSVSSWKRNCRRKARIVNLPLPFSADFWKLQSFLKIASLVCRDKAEEDLWSCRYHAVQGVWSSVCHSLMMSLKGRSNSVKLGLNSVAHLLYRCMGENGVWKQLRGKRQKS